MRQVPRLALDLEATAPVLALATVVTALAPPTTPARAQPMPARERLGTTAASLIPMDPTLLADMARLTLVPVLPMLVLMTLR